MRKRIYIKNINCPMTNEMFDLIKEITDEKEITFAEFIRDSIIEKFRKLKNDKYKVM